MNFRDRSVELKSGGGADSRTEPFAAGESWAKQESQSGFGAKRHYGLFGSFTFLSSGFMLLNSSDLPLGMLSTVHSEPRRCLPT